MLKFQKDLTSSFCFLSPQENVTPDDGQNPGVTKIPLPLRAGDKNVYFTILCPFFMSDGRNERVNLPHGWSIAINYIIRSYFTPEVYKLYQCAMPKSIFYNTKFAIFGNK